MWTDFKVHMNDPYFVGTFEAGGKRIGFLRLATWHNDSWKWDIKQLEKEIEYLNNNTDALVIDQTDNGGGSPCYMNSVASFFITEQKNEMKMQMRANRTWLAQVEDWYDKSMGEEKIHATAWVESLHKAVESGNFLSDPVPICNPVGKIMPHRNSDGNLVLYTKPVLLLINELDYSAADMFAAVMKDWGVATLFGTRTVGAGGYVMETSLIGNSELTLWMTTSLLYRENSITLPNGKATHYIENVGVEPDIKYERTLKDYLDGYQDYRAAIETAVVGLIFN
jgi:C-terminal processing protease CtpA/Prc